MNIENFSLFNDFRWKSKSKIYPLDIIKYPKNKNTQKKLYSFDIFDTLIRRNTLLPIGIFYSIQKELKNSSLNFTNYFINNYPKIRKNAEADTRDYFRKTTLERNSNKLEIKFNDIFNRMAEIFNLSLEQKQFLMNIEIEEELKSVERNPLGLSHLDKILKTNHDIILISDMYLPKEVVKKLIKKVNPILLKLPLYLSSEIGHQKSTGKLYQHIFFDTAHKYKEWIHYGDNKYADGIIPRLLNIRTIVHDIDKFSPFESGLINRLNNYEGFLLATKMQRYRYQMLDIKAMSFNKEEYFAYSYVGLWLVPYINWVINDAIAKGYKKIYFISRDGYFLKIISDIIIKNNNYNLKTKYIYGSRKIWRFAITSDKIEELFTSPHGILGGINTLSEIVSASQMPEDKLLRIIPSFEKYRNNTNLSVEERRQIGLIFISSNEYMTFIRSFCEKKHALVTNYLKQEVNFNENFAFVEFWGRGYTQELLTNLLKQTIHKEIKNPFYYVRCIYENKNQSIKYKFMLNSINFWFVEPIFSLVGYESISDYFVDKNHIIRPVIHKLKHPLHDKVKKGLENFTQDFTNIIKDTYMQRQLAEYSYEYFTKNPNDQYICEVFGELDFNLGLFQKIKKIAPPLTKENIINVKKKKLSSITMSLPISLSKTKSDIRNLYFKYNNSIYKNIKLPPQKTNYFPKNNLNNYIKIKKLPLIILSLKKQHTFPDVSWKYKNNEFIEKDEFIEVSNVVWTTHATPRLYTEKGYITANKLWVKPINKILIKKNIPSFETLNNIEKNITNKSKKFKENELLDVLGIKKIKNKSYFLTKYGYIFINEKEIELIDDDIEKNIYNKPSYIRTLTNIDIYNSIKFTTPTNSGNFLKKLI